MKALILGGGLAGAAAAAGIGSGAVLLEREAGPHDKICGEFLSGEADALLGRLGFDLARLGGAPIDRVRLRLGTRVADARLGFVATGISRRVLDAALLEHAEARGADVRRGVTVRSLAEAQAMAAGVPLLLATGKHELRGAARARAGTRDDLVGFKMFFRAPGLARRLAGAVEVVLLEGGYAGLQPVEGGRLNLCLLVSRARLAELGGRWAGLWPALLAEPALAPLGDAEMLLARPLAISAVPYGYRAQAGEPGLWRLGDQAAVIPSFCGDGMSIALRSGGLAAAMLAAGAGAPAFQARLAAETRRPVGLAMAVQRLGFSPLARLGLMTGLGAAPGLMGWLARATRVMAPAQASSSMSQ
jgi:flavin-dependent dehydrogenase